MDWLRRDADEIVRAGIKAVLPDEAVIRALKEMEMPAGKLILVAAGKAAWQMARAAINTVKADAGIVITKYDHAIEALPGIACYEAGHPVPYQNGFDATEKAIELAGNLSEGDMVLFLLSGGGSALFESPLIPGEELQDITKQLLACGADIVEINTIRKRLSRVKGGRFAEICAPAKVFTIILSDIIGDPLDMIASGPAYPDSSTCRDALDIVKKYDLKLTEKAMQLLHQETPKSLDNVTTLVTGSVRELCKAVADKCTELGYKPVILTDCLDCEARDAGRMLAEKLIENADCNEKLAFIAGGETVVHVTGTGLGGRNQEIALAAAPLISGLEAAVFSFGSDGTDGPTDAAGGYADGDSLRLLNESGWDVEAVLADNDAYHALESVGGLLVTGPTGTNVNDAAVALLYAKAELNI
jgi:hydroxypyruvate reductase